MEFPRLNELLQKYASQGFEVITINVRPEDSPTGQMMMSKQKFGFINLQAPESEWFKKYNFNGCPATFLLDTEGKVIFSHEGYSPEGGRQMDMEIAGLLARAAQEKAKAKASN